MMIIGDVEARKLGKELTSKHPRIVFGMARSSTSVGSGFQITSTSVTAVRPRGCDLTVILCRGDLCERKTSYYAYPTPPPPAAAASLSELDTILQTIVRNDVLSPKLTWLVTDPVTLFVAVVVAALFYGTWIGADRTADALLMAPRLESTLGAIFGSPQAYAHFVVGLGWFTIVAHAFEACSSVYYCQSTLLLGAGPTILWGILVFWVGYPVFSRLQQLVSIGLEDGGGRTKSN